MFFPELQKKVKERTLTVPMERIKRDFALFTDEELYSRDRTAPFVFDIECYPNYFLIAFKCYETGKVVYFERTETQELNIEKLLWLLISFPIVGFSSETYDIPLTFYALTGASCNQLKAASDDIILNELRPSEVEKRYGFRIFEINHVDLIEVAPLQASLKAYGGRLHADRMQDLPFDPNLPLLPEEIEAVRLYCVNDLDNTLILAKELSPQLTLRYQLSLDYGQDLRSKSDAQIAEAVIASEVAKLNKHFPKRPTIEPGTSFKYEIPDYIQYTTPQLQQTLEVVRNANFVVSDKGSVTMPKEIGKLKIKIGSSVYKMGIGGLHSTEQCVSHKADENTLLIDRDVASYYPRIILNLKLFPKHLTENFLSVYDTIVVSRLKYKKSDKLKADSLKIVINGGFGKLGSKYSILYSPNLMIGVTMTGQLSLLMLIEMIECAGIPVISGNTDGIVIKCPKARYEDLEAIIKLWEQQTRFETEETRYKAIYSRDVNNYFAIKEKGDEKARFLEDKLGCKVKGCYAERGSALNSVLSKNPEHLICSDAVIKLFVNGTPIEETIYNCKDIRRFVTVRSVTGGAEKNGVYLGKSIRWYYAEGIEGTINYVKNGNKVPKSEGAKPLMDLPPSFPNDINYKWYVDKTIETLTEIGYFEKKQENKQISFF